MGPVALGAVEQLAIGEGVAGDDGVHEVFELLQLDRSQHARVDELLIVVDCVLDRHGFSLAR
jgi:hypothetical protein